MSKVRIICWNIRKRTKNNGIIKQYLTRPLPWPDGIQAPADVAFVLEPNGTGGPTDIQNNPQPAYPPHDNLLARLIYCDGVLNEREDVLVLWRRDRVNVQPVMVPGLNGNVNLNATVLANAGGIRVPITVQIRYLATAAVINVAAWHAPPTREYVRMNTMAARYSPFGLQNHVVIIMGDFNTRRRRSFVITACVRILVPARLPPTQGTVGLPSRMTRLKC